MAGQVNVRANPILRAPAWALTLFRSYVSLSMGQIQPTLDGFLPVGVLPEFDRDEHQTGEGPLAVCLPPLIGDIYAHEMRDFVEYYRALGVTQFYSYVMDPGPASLDVLRRLAKADDFQVVRWGVPIGWQFESVAHQQPKQDFLVDPATWRIPGLEPLDPIIENGLGITEDGFFDIRLWYVAPLCPCALFVLTVCPRRYNGQTPANQDCTFRAMRDGTRWLASLDWDEFLVLRPPEGRWPAPSAGKRPHFIDFARSLEPLWAWPDSMGPPTAHELGLDASALTKGMLPTSYIFRSSFVCESCQPTEPPPPTPMYQQLRRQYPQLNLTHPAPGVPLLFASPVRHDDFFVHGARSKAISDPWAWYTIGIHFPGMGFPQYAVERAPQLCASSWNTTQRSDADKRCGAKLLSTFGPSSFDVRVIEPTTAEGSASLKPHSQGARRLRHGHRGLHTDGRSLRSQASCSTCVPSTTSRKSSSSGTCMPTQKALTGLRMQRARPCSTRSVRHDRQTGRKNTWRRTCRARS